MEARRERSQRAACTYQVRNENLLSDLERHVRVRDGGCWELDERRTGYELQRVLLSGNDEAISRTELSLCVRPVPINPRMHDEGLGDVRSSPQARQWRAELRKRARFRLNWPSRQHQRAIRPV